MTVTPKMSNHPIPQLLLFSVVPDVSDLWAMLQVPAVGHLVLPAHISRVFPQQTNLVVGVSRVPQRVSQMLPGARLRLHSLTNIRRGADDEEK